MPFLAGGAGLRQQRRSGKFGRRRGEGSRGIQGSKGGSEQHWRQGGTGGAGGAGGTAARAAPAVPAAAAGGLGAGGDIFVETGGSCRLPAARSPTVGRPEAPAQAAPGSGQGYGTGIFVEGNQSVTFGTGQTSGQTTTVNGVITDQTGSDTGNSITDPGAGSVISPARAPSCSAARNLYRRGYRPGRHTRYLVEQQYRQRRR